eukprot:gene17814-9502_t
MKLAIEHAQQQKARQAEADLHKQTKNGCNPRWEKQVQGVAEPDEEKEGWVAQSKVRYCGECDLFGGAGDRDVEDMEEDVHDYPSISPITGKNMEIRSEEDSDDSGHSKEETIGSDDILNIIRKKKPKKKLIFQNTKNQRNGEIYAKIIEELKVRAKEKDVTVVFDAKQLRTRFKRAVCECKKVAITMKTATGIKRFQEEKGHGAWFDQLFSLVKTRGSCQPEQAIELQANDNGSFSNEGTPAVDGETCKALFVPAKQASRRGKQNNMEEIKGMLKELIKNDSMQEFISFAREEAEKSRQHEIKMMQMLLQTETPNQAITSPPHYPQVPENMSLPSSSRFTSSPLPSPLPYQQHSNHARIYQEQGRTYYQLP